MPSLDRIQSIIVQRAPEGSAALLVFQFGPVEAARAFLRTVLVETPSARHAEPRPARVLHPSLTWRGIAQLAVGSGLDPEEGRHSLEPFFVSPLPSHPEALGFVGDSAPERWWDGAWSSADADMVVHVLASDEAALGAACNRLRTEADANGLHELRIPSFAGGAMAGRRPEGGVLHFGYRDGVTSPDVDWLGDGARPVDFRESFSAIRATTIRRAPSAMGPGATLCETARSVA